MRADTARLIPCQRCKTPVCSSDGGPLQCLTAGIPGTDGLTDLLRSAWKPNAQAGDDTDAATVGPDSIQLRMADAAGVGSMTLWDMLCGRFQSRVPGMDAFNERVRPPRWAGWDPCSKNRSR